jgi:hypothetical protein
MSVCRAVDNQCLVALFGHAGAYFPSGGRGGDLWTGSARRALAGRPSAEGVSGRALIIGGGGYDALSPQEALDLATVMCVSSIPPVRALAGLQALAYFPIKGRP